MEATSPRPITITGGTRLKPKEPTHTLRVPWARGHLCLTATKARGLERHQHQSLSTMAQALRSGDVRSRASSSTKKADQRTLLMALTNSTLVILPQLVASGK